MCVCKNIDDAITSKQTQNEVEQNFWKDICESCEFNGFKSKIELRLVVH